jgi:hypothetical protein
MTADTATHIPHGPGDFTAPWLTTTFRDAGVIPPGATVTSVTTTPCGEGSGLLGSLTRLHLAYDPPGAGPASVVAKFPHVADFNRDLAHQYRIYEREYRFYTQVAPGIATRIPRMLAAAFDPATLDGVILLEDLGDRRIGDQLDPPGDEDVARAIGEVAALHTAWWDRVGGDDVAWVPALNDPIWLQVAASFDVFLPNFREHFGQHLTPQANYIADRFQAVLPALAERLTRPPITLLHGDFRVDNLCFGAAPHHDPLVVMDWQLISRGRGPYDLAYFLSQNLEPADRARIERDIVQQYHESLLAKGVTGYSLDQCFEDYRVATVWCLMYPVAAGGGMDLANERGVALATAMATRSIAAIEHLDGARLVDELLA